MFRFISLDFLNRYFGRQSPSQLMAKDCRACKKRNTMDCPNSAECYSTIDKPYFEAW